MTERSGRVIELREYQKVALPREAFPEELGEAIWRRWAGKIEVDFPTPKTDHQWQLQSLGWVGHIPMDGGLTLYLSPKVPLENLFRLLEYAYSLDLHFPGGLTGCDALTEFYERLANILARRVLDRGLRGLYRSYLERREPLPYLRGRLDLRHQVRRPWDISLSCHYDEQTADLEENRIILWTLSRIARSHMCGDRVLPTVRRAYRLLLGAASLEPFDPSACIGRLYNRLNDDYEPLHALCRFFLEHAGPSHQVGDHTMLPFLIDMATLFERFVHRWLEDHLPPAYSVRAQERIHLGDQNELHYVIDLVISERSTGRTLCVLDTKYKRDPRPSNPDINQVTVYALAKSTSQAILVYPQQPENTFRATIGPSGVRVRSLGFPVDGNIEAAGHTFLSRLLDIIGAGGTFQGIHHQE